MTDKQISVEELEETVSQQFYSLILLAIKEQLIADRNVGHRAASSIKIINCWNL